MSILQLRATGRKPMLTAAEEQLLVHFIRDAALRAMPVTKLTLIEPVQEILKQDDLNGYERDYQAPNSNLTGWYKGFRARHPNIVVRTPENLTRSRKNLSVAMIKQWFSDVRSYLNNHDLSEVLKDPSRVFRS